MTREQAVERLADALYDAQSSGHSGCQDAMDRFRPWARTLLAEAGAVFIDPDLVEAVLEAKRDMDTARARGDSGTLGEWHWESERLTLADAVLADYAPPRPR